MPLFTWPFSIGSRLISEISMRYVFPHMLGRADFEDQTRVERRGVLLYTIVCILNLFPNGTGALTGKQLRLWPLFVPVLGSLFHVVLCSCTPIWDLSFLVPERHCPPIWDLSFMVPEKHLSIPFWCSAWIFGRSLAYNFLIKMSLFEKVVTTEL